ncbi:hypothetical protein [Kibdelosporangium phytohabitans]|uniref:Uncharacterized protein n=1 Tax=Kibdelosporangium phytohabitans TaxID=860235 RepID=A0A0N9HWW1_9PSEU|nr:hypothetical protein [Kibdelosporangium phytohabitans]ALG09747.1 hypothetical protein AOZ06_25145 [Kibdelosporangium phytohabitans]
MAIAPGEDAWYTAHLSLIDLDGGVRELHERSKARQEGILRGLVSGAPAVRAQAIEDLRAEQLSGDECGHFTVLAVQCPASRHRGRSRSRQRSRTGCEPSPTTSP